jgi:hypothetical protein
MDSYFDNSSNLDLGMSINLPNIEELSDSDLALINATGCDENNNDIQDFEDKREPTQTNRAIPKDTQPRKKRRVMKFADDCKKSSKTKSKDDKTKAPSRKRSTRT